MFPAALITILLGFGPGYADDFRIDTGDDFIEEPYPSSLARGSRRYMYKLDVGSEALGIELSVNTVTGALIMTQRGIPFPGMAFPADPIFIYNSSSHHSGRFGKDNRLNLAVRYITNNKNDNIIIVDEDNASRLFVKSGTEYVLQNDENVCSLAETETGLVFKSRYSDITGGEAEFRFASPYHNYATEVRSKKGDAVFLNYEAGKLISVNYPGEREVFFDYSDGLCTSVRLEMYSLFRFEYTDGMLTKAVRPDGTTAEFRYDLCRKLSEITVNGSSVAEIDYHPTLQHVSSITRPDGSHIGFERPDDFTFVCTAASGGKYTFIRDSLYRTREIIFPGNETYRYFYDEDNLLSEFINPLGGKTEILRDDSSNIRFVILPSGGIKEFGRADTGSRIFTEETGRRHEIIESPQSAVFPLSGGDTIRIHYTVSGMPGKLILPNAAEIDLAMDRQGLINTIRLDKTATYDFKYGPFGNITEVEMPDKRRYKIDYSHGNIGSISVGDTVLYSFLRDDKGNLSSCRKGRYNQYSVSRDSAGRIEKLRYREKSFQFEYFEKELEIISETGGKKKHLFDDSYRSIGLILNGKKIFTRSYGQNGLIEECVGLYGETKRYKYNKSGLPKKITGTGDTEFSYTPYGQIEEIKTPFADYSMEYDEAARRIAVKKNSETIRETEYHGIDIPVSGTESGNRIYYDYDKYFRRIASGPAGSRKSRYRYDPTGRLEYRQSGKSGVYEEYIRDLKNRLTRKTVNGSHSIFYRYTDADRISEIADNPEFTDARRYEYDSTGYLAKIISPEGVEMTPKYTHSCLTDFRINGISIFACEYDSFGRPIEIAVAGESRSEFEYDASGRLKEYRNIKGQKNGFAYSGNSGLLYEISAADNTGLTVETDDDCRISRLQILDNTSLVAESRFDFRDSGFSYIQGNDLTRDYLFDIDDRCTFFESPSGRTYQYVYDSLGKVVRRIDNSGNEVSFAYNSFGQVSETNSLLGSTHYSYSEGKLFRTENSTGSAISFYRYSDGSLKSKNTGNYQISYRYDKDGKLSEIEVEDNKQYEISRDIFGYPKEIKSDNGIYSAEFTITGKPESTSAPGDWGIDFVYDNFDLMTETYIPQAGRSTKEYDSYGRVIRRNSFYLGAEEFSYSPSGKLIEYTDPVGTSRIFRYRTDGLPATVKLNKKDSVTIEYRGNLIKKIYDRAGEATVFFYDDSGRPRRIEYDENIYRSFQIDSSENETVLKVSGERNQNTEYSFDNLFRITRKKTEIPNSIFEYRYTNEGLAGSVSGTGDTNRVYDRLGKLRQETVSGVTGFFEYTPAGVLNFKTEGKLFSVNRNKAGAVSEIRTKYRYQNLDTFNFDYFGNGILSGVGFDNKAYTEIFLNSNNVPVGMQLDGEDYYYLNIDEANRPSRFIKNNIPEHTFEYTASASVLNCRLAAGYSYSYLYGPSGNYFGLNFESLPVIRASTGRFGIDSLRGAGSDKTITGANGIFINRISGIEETVSEQKTHIETKLNFGNGIEKIYSRQIDSLGNTVSVDIAGLSVVLTDSSVILPDREHVLVRDSAGRTERVKPGGVLSAIYRYTGPDTVKMDLLLPGDSVWSITCGFDAFRRPSVFSDNAGNFVKYSYAPSGYLSKIETDTGSVFYKHDIYGNRLEKIRTYVSDSSSDSLVYDTLRYRYQFGEQLVGVDSLATEISDEGRITGFGNFEFIYDFVGNAIEIIERKDSAAADTIRLRYDSRRRLTAIDDKLMILYQGNLPLAFFDSTGEMLRANIYDDRHNLIAEVDSSGRSYSVFSSECMPYRFIVSDSGKVEKTFAGSPYSGNANSSIFLGKDAVRILDTDFYFTDGRIYSEQLGSFLQPSRDLYADRKSRYSCHAYIEGTDEEQNPIRLFVKPQDFFDTDNPLDDKLPMSGAGDIVDSLLRENLAAFFNDYKSSDILPFIRALPDISTSEPQAPAAAEIEFIPRLPEQIFDSVLYRNIEADQSPKMKFPPRHTGDNLKNVINLLRFLHEDSQNMFALEIVDKYIHLIDARPKTDYFPEIHVFFEPDVADLAFSSTRNTFDEIYLRNFEPDEIKEKRMKEDFKQIEFILRHADLTLEKPGSNDHHIFDIAGKTHLPDYGIFYKLHVPPIYDKIRAVDTDNKERMLDNIFRVELRDIIPGREYYSDPRLFIPSFDTGLENYYFRELKQKEENLFIR